MFHLWTKPGPVRPVSRAIVVAVIDDDDAFRRSALRLVRRLGATPVGLLDTGAALRWVVVERPRIVITDLARVPAMCAAVAALPADARPLLVATSLHADDGDDAVARRAGAAALLPRPQDPERFLQTVGALLQDDEGARASV